MMFKTHFVIGILIGLLAVTIIKVTYPVIFILIIALSTSLPDIDHPKSKLGRKIPFISWPLNIIFRHRGIFHSIFLPLIILIILIYFKLSYFAIAIALGYIAHLFADAITKEGVAFLYPLSKLKLRGPVSTNGLMEKGICFIIILADILITVRLFNPF